VDVVVVVAQYGYVYGPNHVYVDVYDHDHGLSHTCAHRHCGMG
jgi:hypothetical protein